MRNFVRKCFVISETEPLEAVAKKHSSNVVANLLMMISGLDNGTAVERISNPELKASFKEVGLTSTNGQADTNVEIVFAAIAKLLEADASSWSTKLTVRKSWKVVKILVLFCLLRIVRFEKTK
jgi:hypothetical protein